MARSCASWQIVVLALCAAGCLYMDPINAPPTVTIVELAPVHAGKSATFLAQVSDPDQSAATVAVTWWMAASSCAEVTRDGWVSVPAVTRTQVDLVAPSKAPFCLQARVRDSQGAERRAQVDVHPENQAPTVQIGLTSVEPAARVAAPAGPGGDASLIPWHSSLKLTAEAFDGDAEDRARLTYAWQVTGPGGLVAKEACAEDDGTTRFCFRALAAGPYVASLRVTDPDGAATTTERRFAVDEDRPPCIRTVRPGPGGVIRLFKGSSLVMAVYEVADETHALPPVEDGSVPTFAWSYLDDGTEVALPPGELASAPARWPDTNVTGQPELEDTRPGKTYRVRVEVRDPLRETAAEIAKLHQVCGDAADCESPPGCKRWITWKVELQP